MDRKPYKIPFLDLSKVENLEEKLTLDELSEHFTSIETRFTPHEAMEPTYLPIHINGQDLIHAIIQDHNDKSYQPLIEENDISFEEYTKIRLKLLKFLLQITFILIYYEHEQERYA